MEYVCNNKSWFLNDVDIKFYSTSGYTQVFGDRLLFQLLRRYPD